MNNTRWKTNKKKKKIDFEKDKNWNIPYLFANGLPLKSRLCNERQ